MNNTEREHIETAERIPAREGYDRWAPNYDDADPSTLLDEPFMRAQCEPLEGLRVLDLGCGTGRYLRQLHGTGARITAFDLSQAMLLKARGGVPDAASTMWVQGNAEYLPFRPGSFDRIVSGLVLDHVTRLDRFFTGVADALAPGGRAVIAAIHPDMQRLTGPAVRFATGDQQCRIEGIIHEVADVLKAATHAGLSIATCEEPRVTEALVDRHPHWQSRLGSPALLLLVCEKH
ncbi:MAG TPA: methyltransferase domain-containing protein [Nitrospiraceae bacterium]|nr:methyltransferase domain-containing protein [Nitrospiraceae bacterium]